MSSTTYTLDKSPVLAALQQAASWEAQAYPGSEEPARQPEIVEKLNTLGMALQQVQNNLDVLVRHLSPVMRSSDTKSKGESGTALVSQATPIGSELQSYINHVNILIQQIYDVTEALEI